MRRLQLLLVLLLLTGPAFADRQENVLVREQGESKHKIFYQEIVRTDRVNLRVENYRNYRSTGAETIKLKEDQVEQLRKAFEESLPVPKGEPDALVIDLEGPYRNLTLMRYGNHRRRAFLLTVEDPRRGGKAHFLISKSRDDLERFSRFLRIMEAAAKRR